MKQLDGLLETKRRLSCTCPRRQASLIHWMNRCSILQSYVGTSHRGTASLEKRFRIRAAWRQGNLATDGADAVG